MGKKETHRRSRSSSESSDDGCNEEHLKKMYMHLRTMMLKDKSLQVNGSDAFGCFYSLDTQQINPGEAIHFEQIQATRNIDLDAFGYNIYVRRDGLYYIVLHITPVGASQWTLFINNIPQYDRVFGTLNSSGQISISYLVALRADDVITFRNYQSETAVVSIPQIVGGTDPGANVEVIFEKIAPYPENKCGCGCEQREHHNAEEMSERKEHRMKKQFEILKKWVRHDPGLKVDYNDLAFGSFYSTTTQSVAPDASVLFANNTNVLHLSHVLGSGDIKIQKDGFYLFSFIVETSQACQFTVYVNGVPNQTTTCGINKGANVLQLRQIIELKVGDLVSVRNHVSAAGTITITPNAGGTLNGVCVLLSMSRISVPTCLIENLEQCNPCELEKDCMYRRFKHYLLEDENLSLQGCSAYFYTSSTALQTLNLEDPVLLNLHGPLRNTYFKTGTTTVTVLKSGVYKLKFDLEAKQPSQFTIYVNDVPQESTIAGTDSGSGQISIRQLVQLNKGDVLSVKNHSSFMNPVQTVVNPGGYLASLNVIFMGVRMGPLPKKCLPPPPPKKPVPQPGKP